MRRTSPMLPGNCRDCIFVVNMLLQAIANTLKSETTNTLLEAEPEVEIGDDDVAVVPRRRRKLVAVSTTLDAWRN